VPEPKRKPAKADPADTPEKSSRKGKGKKKRPPPAYVETRYPFWLGILSFGWALVGWLIATAAPHLAFVPGVGVLHVLAPAVTVVLIGVNLCLAVQNLRRGVHVLRLLVVTGVQVALFTTLFYQLYAHGGAELYDATGPTTPWQWVQFSIAHGLRAWDVIDVIEAYGWRVQPIKHTSWVVAVFVIAYHVVVDVFFLVLIWVAVGRLREAMLEDVFVRGLVVRIGLAVLAVWFLTWVVYAFFVRPWRPADIPLWFLENFLRTVDFADVMESFGIHLHTLPREGMVGTLTALCRVFIGVGIGILLTRKRTPPQRRVLTPPGEAAGPYWRRRVGALFGMAAALVVVALVGRGLTGDAALGLVEAVKAGPESRSEAALRALRRMGPAAAGVAPELVAARAGADGAVRDQITRTLGYLGPSALDPLREIALTEPAESAGVAADALGAIGVPAAPALAAVAEGAQAEAAREAAAARLTRIGSAAVGPLMDAFSAVNAEAHYTWLEKLDPNWKLRRPPNAVAAACQSLPDLVAQLAATQDPASTAEILRGIGRCGSAARVALPAVLDRLGDRDAEVQAAAAGVVVGIGPTVTPALLDRLGGADPTTPVSPGVLTALGDERMWDAAALRHPKALPAMLNLIRRPGSQAQSIALRHLGSFGPDARPAVPYLVLHVADPNEDTRAAVRRALDGIDPQWKTDPAVAAALTSLVYEIAALPPAERDELNAAVGDLEADGADRLNKAVGSKLSELRKQYTGAQPAVLDQYKADLEGVFGPLDRLGPKLRPLVPYLARLARDNREELNDRKAPILAARALRTAEVLADGAPETIPSFLMAIDHRNVPDKQYMEEGLAIVRKFGPAAVPQIGGLIDNHLQWKNRMVGFRAAEALGRDAAELAPRVVAAFQGCFTLGDTPGSPTGWMMEHAFRTLNAIDPDWPAIPEAAPALARLVQGASEGEVGARRRKLLALIEKTGKNGRPLAAPLAAELLLQGWGLDRTARSTVTALDAKWEESPAFRAPIPTLASRLAEKGEKAAADALAVYGSAAVTAIVEELNRERKEQARARLLLLPSLRRLGPAAKDAVPAVVKIVGEPGLPPEVFNAALDAVFAIDPQWSADAKWKDAAAAIARDMVVRAESDPEKMPEVARLGPAAATAIADRIGAAEPRPRLYMFRTLSKMGKAGATATPAVVKLLADKDPAVRGSALSVMADIGEDQPDLVPTLLPLLVETTWAPGEAAVQALEKADPKWRDHADAKKVAARAIALLSDKDAKKRRLGLSALTVIGPADGVLAALTKTAITPAPFAEVDIRAGAIAALGKHGGKDRATVPTLLGLLTDIDEQSRLTAAQALDAADPKWRDHAGVKAATARAIKLLSEKMPQGRLAGLDALKAIGPADGVVAAVEKMLAAEQDPNVQPRVRQALQELKAPKDPKKK
jgi:hypothetical protein